MKQYVAAFLLSLLSAGAFAKDVSGTSYDFTLPDDVTYETNADIEFYTFTWGAAPDLSLFMLNMNPAPVPASALESMATMMEKMLEAQISEQDGMTVIRTNRTPITCGVFKGYELAFVVSSKEGQTVNQYMFILHDGKRAWNGQLTASSDTAIEKARQIMSGAKAKQPNGIEQSVPGYPPQGVGSPEP